MDHLKQAFGCFLSVCNLHRQRPGNESCFQKESCCNPCADSELSCLQNNVVLSAPLFELPLHTVGDQGDALSIPPPDAQCRMREIVGQRLAAVCCRSVQLPPQHQQIFAAHQTPSPHVVLSCLRCLSR